MNNSIDSNLDDKQDQLCAKTISEIVKLASDKVQGKQQRTASITSKTDEVGLLQSFLSKIALIILFLNF